MSFEDVEAIKNLYRTYVCRCCDRNGARRVCHVKAIILIIHIYTYIQPLIAWTLLWKVSQSIQSNASQQISCDCRHRDGGVSVKPESSFGSTAGPVNIAILPSNFSSFGRHIRNGYSFQATEVKIYEREYARRLAQSKAQLVQHIRNQERSMGERFIPASTLFENLGYKNMSQSRQPARHQYLHLFAGTDVEQLDEISSISISTNCLHMLRLDGFGDFFSKAFDNLSDCNDVKLVCDAHVNTFLAYRSTPGEDTPNWHDPCLLSTFNLDLVVANDDGVFKWTEAVYRMKALSRLVEDLYERWRLEELYSRPIRVIFPERVLRDGNSETRGSVLVGGPREVALDLITRVERGGFTDTARNVRLDPSSMLLEADLRCQDGSYRYARLSLNERIIVLENRLRYVFMGEVYADRRHVNNSGMLQSDVRGSRLVILPV